MIRPMSPISRSYIARRPGFTPVARQPGLAANILPGAPLTPGAVGWTNDGLTFVGGQTDPLGGTNASQLTDTALNVLHRCFQNFPSNAGQQWLVSVSYKPGTFTQGFSLTMFDSVFAFVAYTNAGAVGNFGGAGVSSPSVSPQAGGWFRASFIYTCQANASVFWLIEFGQIGQQAYLGTVQNQLFFDARAQLIT